MGGIVAEKWAQGKEGPESASFRSQNEPGVGEDFIKYRRFEFAEVALTPNDFSARPKEQTPRQRNRKTVKVSESSASSLERVVVEWCVRLGPLPSVGLRAMWRLIIEDDDSQRTVVPLTRDDYTIGRREGNNIRLTERNVSRDHARIRKIRTGTSESHVIEDLQSYMGVYINGLRIRDKQEIHHGDLMQIGDYRVLLQDDSLGDFSTDDAKTTLPAGGRASLTSERPNRLVMLAGPAPGVEFPLDLQEKITLGRAEDASISINHSSVSRAHCEIHALGEGRFEIIDMESSNGVRVNGIDLKRRIIEAGDIIELGDVRLKFVGAGQFFLPELDDLRGTTTPDKAGTRYEGGSILPWLFLGAILAAAGVVAIRFNAYARQMEKTRPPTQEEVERKLVDEAIDLCGDREATLEGCDTARLKLNSLPLGSLVRAENASSLEMINAKWINLQMGRASQLTSDAEKRSVYEMVIENTKPEDSNYKKSKVFLQEIAERAAAVAASASAPSASASSAPTALVAHPTTTTAPSVNTTAALHAPKPKPPETPAPTKSSFDRARQAFIDGNRAEAKQIMLAKHYKSTLTQTESEFLYELCANSDRGCVESLCKSRFRPPETVCREFNK